LAHGIFSTSASSSAASRRCALAVSRCR